MENAVYALHFSKQKNVISSENGWWMCLLYMAATWSKTKIDVVSMYVVPFNCRRIHIENLCLTNANKSNLKNKNQIWMHLKFNHKSFSTRTLMFGQWFCARTQNHLNQWQSLLLALRGLKLWKIWNGFCVHFKSNWGEKKIRLNYSANSICIGITWGFQSSAIPSITMTMIENETPKNTHRQLERYKDQNKKTKKKKKQRTRTPLVAFRSVKNQFTYFNN